MKKTLTIGTTVAALLLVAAGTAAVFARDVKRPEGVGRLNVVRVDFPAGRDFTNIATIPVIGPVQLRCSGDGQAAVRFGNRSGQTIHSYLDKGGANPIVEVVRNGASSRAEEATGRDLWVWRIASEGDGVPWRVSTQVLGIHETGEGCTVHLNWHSFPARPGEGR